MREIDDSPRSRMRGEIMGAVVAVLVSAAVAAAFVFWKHRSDRGQCHANVRNVQQAMRGYQGMKGYLAADSMINWPDIIGPGKMTTRPVCPAGGTYHFRDRYPAGGVLAMECDQCNPPSHAGW